MRNLLRRIATAVGTLAATLAIFVGLVVSVMGFLFVAVNIVPPGPPQQIDDLMGPPVR